MMLHIIRVYWRYWWGKIRGRSMHLIGRPGQINFMAIRLKRSRQVRICDEEADLKW